MARDFVRASSQYLSNANALVSAAPFSVSVWFNWHDTGGSNQVLFSIGDVSAADDHWMLYAATGGTSDLYWLAQDSGNLTQQNKVATTNAWHHGCGVETASDDRDVYVDGVAGTQYVADCSPANADTTRIGFNVRSGVSWHFDGVLAECGLWNIALTAAEVSVLATGISPLAVRPQSLVAYWPLMGNLSPEPDLLENKYSMTLNGGPTKADHPPIMYPVSHRLFYGDKLAPVELDRSPGNLAAWKTGVRIVNP